jgi:hypothetical protein
MRREFEQIFPLDTTKPRIGWTTQFSNKGLSIVIRR